MPSMSLQTPFCDWDVVTTFIIVNIYRFAVAAKKGGRQVELSFDVRQISNAKYTLLWWSRIFSEVHFVGLQHKSRKPTWIAETLFDIHVIMRPPVPKADRKCCVKFRTTPSVRTGFPAVIQHSLSEHLKCLKPNT